MDRFSHRARSNIMRGIRSSGNKTTEVRFRMALVRNHISGWKIHQKGVFGNPDISFPQAKIAIFIDGCFWHGCPTCYIAPTTSKNYWKEKLTRNQKRDKDVTYLLSESGWKVIRFWEHEMKETKGPISLLMDMILHAT